MKFFASEPRQHSPRIGGNGNYTENTRSSNKSGRSYPGNVRCLLAYLQTRHQPRPDFATTLSRILVPQYSYGSDKSPPNVPQSCHASPNVQTNTTQRDCQLPRGFFCRLLHRLSEQGCLWAKRVLWEDQCEWASRNGRVNPSSS